MDTIFITSISPIKDCLDNQFDIVLTKKNLNGTTLWEKRDASLNKVSCLNPTITSYQAGGNSYFYLVFQTAGIFQPDQEHFYPYAIVVLKLDADGNIIWARQNSTFNTTRSNESPAVAVDPIGVLDAHGNVIDEPGSVYVTYQTTGRVIGGYRIAFKDRYDIVEFKLDPNGNTKWVKQIRQTNCDFGGERPCIQYDRSNPLEPNVYIAYTTFGRVNDLTVYGGGDIVVFKLNALTGALQIRTDGSAWVVQGAYNTATEDLVPSLSVDNFGFVYLCHSTGAGGYVSGFTNLGGDAIVIAKLSPDRWKYHQNDTTFSL